MNASLRFLYVYCNDLDPIRHFYSELLGLEEIYFSAGEAVAYRCDKLQFTVIQTNHPLPDITGWALQPGWAGGTQLEPSWSVECSKAAFNGAVRRLQKAGVPAFLEAPVWVGYWSFPILDPMGYTVELTCPSDELGDL